MTSPTGAGIQRVMAVHGGIEYPGEQVRAPQWLPALGTRLQGDTYFRVVFLERRPTKRLESLEDQRITVCVPGSRPGRSLRRAEEEVRLLREAQVSYLTKDDASSAVDRRNQELIQQIADGWAAAFRRGSLLGGPPLEERLDAVFAGGDWTTWAEQDAPLLFDAFAGAGGSAAHEIALDSFAVGLGLAYPESPRMLTLDARPALTIIEEAYRSDAGELGVRLAHGEGLTYPLAALFTLLYLTRGPLELQLRPDHGLRLRDGEPLETTRITWNTLPRLEWPRNLWAVAMELRGLDTDPWQQALPYLRVLDPTLDERHQPTEQEQQERLSDWMGTMSDGLLAVTRQLNVLASAQRRELSAEEAMRLSQLQQLAQAGDAAALPSIAEDLFGGANDFRSAIRLWEEWRNALVNVPDMVDALQFMEQATVPEKGVDLFTERQILLERLRDRDLAMAPHQWAGVVQAAEVFRDRYATAYIRHHGTYHAAMGLLGQRLAETRLEARALNRLNAIASLGQPVAPELPGLVEELYNNTSACGAEPTADSIERDARCVRCGIALESTPPQTEVETLAGYVREALQQQNRRLGGLVVRRLLDRPSEARLDKFIQVVQVSDLSGLAQVLDDELGSFIHDLVNEGT